MADAVGTAAGRFWKCRRCGTPNPAASYLVHCLGCGAPRGATPVEPAPGEAVVVIRPRRGRGVLAASWVYAAAVLLALGVVRWVGDVWWGVTLLLIAPRWVLLAPVAALAMASAVRRCPGHWAVQGATALVIAGPLMGLSVPVHLLWERPPRGDRLRLATINTGGHGLPGHALRDWLARERVDVVCLQEVSDNPEMARGWLGEGWAVSRDGSVATRLPLVAEWPRYEHQLGQVDQMTGRVERVRLRAASGAEFVAASVHLPTLRPGLEALLAGRGGGTLDTQRAWWAREAQRMLSALAEAGGPPMVVAGDFNMPSDDSTMAALKAHFRFAFEAAGWGYGYTRPSRLPWVRIDHVLTSPEWYVASCRVGPDLGSDHLPVLAELVLPPPPTRPARPEDSGPEPGSR